MLVPETTFNKVKKPQNDTNYGSSATFMVPIFECGTLIPPRVRMTLNMPIDTDCRWSTLIASVEVKRLGQSP